jgi:hypothetical protein
MTFWKRQNYGNSKKVSSCQRLTNNGNEKAEHKGFLGQWTNAVCNAIMMNAYLYIFVETHSVYTSSES